MTTHLAALLIGHRVNMRRSCPRSWAYIAIATRAGVRYRSRVYKWESGIAPCERLLPIIAAAYFLSPHAVREAWMTDRAIAKAARFYAMGTTNYDN